LGLEDSSYQQENLMDVFRYTVNQQLELAQDPDKQGYRKKPFSVPEDRKISKKWESRLLFFNGDKD
jgi:hypothetical protein